MLKLTNIHYTVAQQSVLKGVHWSLPSGEHALVLGASGSGKTTLLHIIAGLLKPNNGVVILNAQDTSALTERARDQLRGSQMGMIFQTLHLIPALTVRDNLKLAGYFSHKPVNDADILTLLQKLDIAALVDRFPHTLSVGQAQRVAIARALVHRPSFILADEPTSALDDANANATISLLLEQAKECGASVIVATHDARIMPHFKHRLSL